MKSILLGMILAALTGCSFMQWLPTSACDYVFYERVKDRVTINAECAR